MNRSGPPAMNDPLSGNTSSKFLSWTDDGTRASVPPPSSEPPINMADHEKTLEHYLSGELKPISCRPLGADNFACREMTRDRDGSHQWDLAPNFSTAFRQMRYLKDEEHGARAPAASSLAQKLSTQDVTGVKINQLPTRISTVAL